MRSKHSGVLGRWMSECGHWAGPATALGLLLTGCTELGGPEDLEQDDEITERSAFKGFEKEFAAATKESLWIELFDSKFGNVRITAEVPASVQDSQKKS